MRHVARVADCYPLDLWYSSEERSDADVLRLVVLAIDQERRYLDLVHLVDNRPVLQRPDDREL